MNASVNEEREGTVIMSDSAKTVEGVGIEIDTGTETEVETVRVVGVIAGVPAPARDLDQGRGPRSGGNVNGVTEKDAVRVKNADGTAKSDAGSKDN
mmetsp:Transcript_6379/g.11324  ORF Transcript_6379/g.11324 Transcript_6379/m.11324 type:complete len:96 (-) Transcript_6379:1504-1791(-)